MLDPNPLPLFSVRFSSLVRCVSFCSHFLPMGNFKFSWIFSLSTAPMNILNKWHNDSINFKGFHNENYAPSTSWKRGGCWEKFYDLFSRHSHVFVIFACLFIKLVLCKLFLCVLLVSSICLFYCLAIFNIATTPKK